MVLRSSWGYTLFLLFGFALAAAFVILLGVVLLIKEPEGSAGIVVPIPQKPTWEYKVFGQADLLRMSKDMKPEDGMTATNLQAILNALGEEGWELCGTPCINSTELYVFKREAGVQVPDKPVRVGAIRIMGNTKTSDSVIMEQLPFGPGRILTYQDLSVAERNLARLGLFKGSPKVAMIDPETPGEFKDILVTVEENQP